MSLSSHIKRQRRSGLRFVGVLVAAFAMVAGLLAITALTAGTTPGSIAAAASSGVDISAGGPAAAPFVADEDFAGGATAAVTNAITTTGITNPAPQSVYQHNRYGNFTYTIPGLTAGASYTVRLDFAEEYWTAAGSRTFNVLINGAQVLTNFDIFATAGGEYKAVAESFTATASSAGAVTIQFVTVKDNAQVNGIEITPTGGGTTTNTVTVTSPGSQTSTVGTAASLQVDASDSASGQTLTYTASGLPAGLSINSSTGLISGTPTTAGTSSVTVTATDTTGAKGTATFTWTVNASSGPGTGGVDISAGGPAAAPFVADEDFTGGATSATTNAITTTGITNPAPQSVWQHNRYGNFTYTIPGLTAGANYKVRLDFAEEYWTAAGSRTFNVLINGTQVLTNFDIFATAGGEFKGGRRVVHRDRQQRRGDHHPVRHRQGQRPGQRHRDQPPAAAERPPTPSPSPTPAPRPRPSAPPPACRSPPATPRPGRPSPTPPAGCPAGLSINSTTGLISGTPTTAGTSSVTVTATDTTGAKGTATFTWTVNTSGTGGTGEPPASFWGNTSAIPAAT